MKRESLRYRAFWLISLLLLSAAPAAARASAYSFEMIVFERPGGGAGENWPAEPGEPDPAQAIGRLGGGGGNTLPASAKSLGPVAYTLKKKGMIVHHHLAWRQTPRGRQSNSWYWIDSGRVSGLVRVSRGRYLHLDTDLILRDANSSQPYRVQLHRRMRSDELHYVDHPKLGIIIQAQRVRTTVPSDPDEPSTGEPKPAAPLPTSQPG